MRFGVDLTGAPVKVCLTDSAFSMSIPSWVCRPQAQLDILHLGLGQLERNRVSIQWVCPDAILQTESLELWPVAMELDMHEWRG